MKLLPPIAALLCLLSGALAAGCKPSAPATRVIASVDSNLSPGVDLDEVRVETFDPAGKTRGGVRVFELSTDLAVQPGKYRFPFSFRVDRKTRNELLFAVSGWKDGEKRVEQRVLVRFASRETRYLQTFLGGICMLAKCAEGQSCYPFSQDGIAAGTCGEVPAAELTALDPRGEDGTWGVDSAPFDGESPWLVDAGGKTAPEGGAVGPDDCRERGVVDGGPCEDAGSRACEEGAHTCDTEAGVQCTATQSGFVCGACPSGFLDDAASGVQNCVPVLDALGVDGEQLYPAFDRKETEYQVDLGPWKDQVGVVFSAFEGHEVRVGGELIASGQMAVQKVELGRTDLEVKVSSLGRSRTYKLQVDRTEAKEVYLKAETPMADDGLGWTVATNSDGTTVVGAAINEDSTGAVYIFTREEGGWSSPTRLQPPSLDPGDGLGFSLAVSKDGTVVAVGAPEDDACPDQDAFGNDCEGTGAVFVYVRGAEGWSPPSYLKGEFTTAGSAFGSSVALSADGRHLVVGSPGYRDSEGLVHYFTVVNGAWYEPAFFAGRDVMAGDKFGLHVSLNNDGDVLAIAAVPQVRAPGKVYLSSRRSGNWSVPVRLEASRNTPPGPGFASGLALSGDGKTLVAGGVEGRQAYVFAQDSFGWTEEAVLGPSNPGIPVSFGSSASLSDDGNTLLVGAYGEEAAYVYTRLDGVWAESRKVLAKSRAWGGYDSFGGSVALAGDGRRAIVGATTESGCVGDPGADPSNNYCPGTGAIYVFE